MHHLDIGIVENMIKKIVIRDIASFDNKGVTLENLKKVNFIYGGNACGKTTISRVISCKDIEHIYQHCEVEWEGEPLQVVTYNKDFRNKNFREADIPGVFTLGHASVEAIEDIERLSKEKEGYTKAIETAASNIAARNIEIQELKNYRQEYLWKKVYKKNEEFKECLRGNLYKSTFDAKILEVIQSGLPSPLPNLEDLRHRYQILFAGGGSPSKRDAIPESSDLILSLLEITDNDIWKRRIIGSDDVPIAALIKKLDIADWVYRGQSFLSSESNVCPFCQKQTIDNSFREQLERFFDENYVNDIELVSSLRSQYSKLLQDVSVFYNDLISKADSDLAGMLDSSLFGTTVQLVKEAMAYNLEMMTSKEKEPGLTIEFKDIRSYMEDIQGMIDTANDAIRANNEMIDNLSRDQRFLINDVWSYLGGLAIDEVQSIEKKIRGKEGAISQHQRDELAAKESYNRVNREIQAKESQVTSIQPTITKINNALKKFGFTGFSIQPSPKDDTKYQIQREDGSLVENTLSEGEITFITFLYYLQLVKGSNTQSNIKSPRVLVIDDPISSLDSNVLFVVSTMIKQLLKEVRESVPGKESDIKQIFILTHNVYFHKEVTFINNRQKSRSDTNHWVLYKKEGISAVKSYGMDNPIKGSYELLWKELRERRNEMDNITIQNVMRRIIENYFIVFGGLNGKELIGENFSDDPEELAIATSFASWYDEGSHDISDDLFVEHPNILTEKYMSVFKRLFDKLGHSAHYNMMMHEGE